MADVKIVLASKSPRRRELLQAAGLPFEVRVSDVDETLDPVELENPRAAAANLADRKAGAVTQLVLAEQPRGATVILGADTMVVLDNVVFGKPRNRDDAFAMLRALSGRTHRVVTGVSVWMVNANEAGEVAVGHKVFAETSEVTFKELSDERIDAYLRCGESFDKAGAYAAQGEGAKLIERVDGDLDTVIGLPVGRLLREFPELAALCAR